MSITLSNIVPDRLYSTTDVATLFDVTAHTVRNWVRHGRLCAIPHQGREPYRFLGVELLRLIGGRVPVAEAETRRDREQRAERRWAEIRGTRDRRSGGQGSR